MKTTTKIAIAGALLFWLYNEKQKRNNNPKVYYVNKIPGGYNGCIIPPFGIFITEAQRNNKVLLEHERVHWMQYQREGLTPFLINYWKEHFKNGYDLNPYEIEARLLSGENECCLIDYTSCVREGRSKTVFNPLFKLK